MLAAKDMGLSIPNDLSIVGVDNHELADFFGITTINQDVHGQAGKLVKTMLQLLDDPEHEVDDQAEWPVELIVRSSTARLVS
jgi:DNA-binding LacI/PurR family transcriptional regulator